MFTMIGWDSLNELLSELFVILILCILLFIWAARVRLRDMDARRRAATPSDNPAGPEATPAQPPPPVPGETSARNDSQP